MPGSIHGHAVMEMMLEQGGSFSRQSLCEAIVARFGEDARFHTCNAADLDAEALVSLLAARGKFVETGEGFNTTPDHVCNHRH